MSLQQYLNNKVLATVSDASEGDATTFLQIYPLTQTMALSGDVVKLIHKGTGREYDLTLSADLDSSVARCNFSSVTFDTNIPVGSVIIESKDKGFDRTHSSLQYIVFSSQAAAEESWKTFSTSGISNHSWNTTTTDKGTTVGTSELTNVSTAIQSVGIVVPYDCTLVGFRATIYRVGNYQTAVGLFCGTPAYNDNATQDFTLRAYAAADNSAGPDSNYSQRPVKAEDLTRSHSLAAGDIIIPAFNSVTNNGGNARISYTIVLKTLKLL
jgi:hypothetical protein|tara:strand:- start:545 stop:1348 length:804 start_codon:yes stop_codon:yes gene_type:complete